MFQGEKTHIKKPGTGRVWPIKELKEVRKVVVFQGKKGNHLQMRLQSLTSLCKAPALSHNRFDTQALFMGSGESSKLPKEHQCHPLGDPIPHTGEKCSKTLRHI